MKLKRNLSRVCMVLATAMVPALAQTVITSPANGEQVSSPFTLNMTASTCSSQPVSAVGYSLDNSGNTSSWHAQYIDGPVAAPSGWHTLHVKVWNGGGGVCVTDVSIDVDATPAVSSSGSSGSVVPSNAVKVSGIQSLGNWTAVHDGGTTGSSSGTMSLTSSPSLTGTSRLFANQFNNFGENATSFSSMTTQLPRISFTTYGSTSPVPQVASQISSSIWTRQCLTAKPSSWVSSATAGFNDGTTLSTGALPRVRTTHGFIPMLHAT